MFVSHGPILAMILADHIYLVPSYNLKKHALIMNLSLPLTVCLTSILGLVSMAISASQTLAANLSVLEGFPICGLLTALTDIDPPPPCTCGGRPHNCQWSSLSSLLEGDGYHLLSKWPPQK